jgi:predicted nicotinamide N-methyase
MIAERPERFFDLNPQDEGRSTLRILELGAGTGLVGLTAFKVLQVVLSSKTTSRVKNVELIATDFQDAVLDNLEHNIQNNLDHQETTSLSTSHSNSSNPSIHPHDLQTTLNKHKLDWSDFAGLPTGHPPLDAQFDVALGADIIYEAEHAAWIRECLLRLLRRPGAHECLELRPAFHLVIPLRHTHAAECKTVEDIFPLCAQTRTTGSDELVTLYKEIITCWGEEGKEGDEVEYVYYRIGWRD